MDNHAGARIGSCQHEIPLLTPRPGREPFGIFIGEATQLDDEQNNSRLLLDPFGVIRLDDAALKLLLHVWHCTQDSEALGFWQKFGLGSLFLRLLYIDITHCRAPSVLQGL